MKSLSLSLMFAFAFLSAHAQMWNGSDTLYGNEWIDYTKPYIKIKVANDGIYRVGFQALSNANFPVGTVPANQLRLMRYGKQEPVFTSTDGLLGAQDFVEFYGEKNRGQVDYFLFEDAEKEQINPLYSIFNDTAVYYLTWEAPGQGFRYTSLPNDLSNLPQKEPYCWSNVTFMPATVAFKKRLGLEITFSWFDGVGYTSAGSASENPVNLYLPGILQAAPDAHMQVRYAGSLNEHYKQILVNDTLYAEDQFSDYKLIDRHFNLPANRLLETTRLKITSPIGDRHNLAYATIRYARDFNFVNGDAVLFSLDASSIAQYIEIQGFNTTGEAPILYDMTNRQRIVATAEAGIVKIKLPASTTARQLLLIRPEGVKQVNTVQPVVFESLNLAGADYLIISNTALFKDPSAGGANRVAEYAAYRSGSAGGNHTVKVVDVENLYEQFAYGVRFHPIAIRNFLHWAKRISPEITHAFILGKALDFPNFRTGAQQSSLADSLFFVPNFSTPGADLPFTMQGNHLSEPIMAIGRLAVTKPAEIHDYLQKVMQQEQLFTTAEQSIAGKAWMKRVIHNSGGLSTEATLIRGHTTAMANALKASRFGADVHAFYKTSDDPIQLSAYEQLLDLVNEGVAVWTIFGHSSAFAVDFDIGLPGSYSNFGRYPLMLVMGCFSGICSAPQQGIGEQFVLAPNRGAIAYIASVNYSFIDALHTYGQQYYQRLGGTDYGASIGLTMSHTIGDLKNTASDALIAVLHQNLLQGDPAVRVYAHDGPDYVIDNQSVKFNPNPVSLHENSLGLSFDVVNIGENTGGFLGLRADQRLPDGVVLQRLRDSIEAPAFKSTLSYPLPVAGSKTGFNRFLMRLDPENKIDENPVGAELNNVLTDASGTPGQDVFFYADDVAPVYPLPYAIIGKPAPTLFASTFNTTALPFRYLFEIDTVETFSSPLKAGTQIVQAGGLLRWAPPVPMADSTVYYWRVARDSLINGFPLWRTRSFLYLNGSTSGWNQSHFGQYKEDAFVNLQALDSLRGIAFKDNAAFVNIQVAYRDVNRYPGFKNAYYQGFYGDVGWNEQGISRGVAMMVVEPNTGRAMMNPANGPYNYNPQKTREFFWFDTRDSLQRVKMVDFVKNGIPDGFYVGLLAFNTPSDAVGYAPHLWGKDSLTQGVNLFQVLEQQGARHARELAIFTAAPPAYGFVFRKNHPEYPALDTVVTNSDAAAEVRASFLAKWAIGFMETPTIGPVKNWKSIHWNRDVFDDNSDQASLSVLAVRPGQEDSLLFTLYNTYDTTLEYLPAKQFPLLKLRYDLADTLTRSATQLKFARLLYDAVPEGALDPTAYFNFYRDTLQQGERLRAGIAFANISDAAFDSLDVRLKVENQANNGFEFKNRLGRLLPGDTLHADFNALTRTIEGPQRLVLEVNPPPGQPEYDHFNNVLFRDFFVAPDKRNPLLDVTFDGQHILNGDLISPSPVVVITLKDENRFLALRDSNTFTVKILSPDGSLQAIPPGDPTVRFFPADPTELPKKNLARFEWRPTFRMDGEYRLTVNGIDATGNESAELDWSVTFNILTKSSLSSLLNYPNPFSTSTCFVYTLTGLETPAHFKIQIMTVAGRVIREITEREFGPLKPGTHQSEFCWDGKDAYGDQLANGVYLYRVVAKKADGTDFEHFDNPSADGFFKHGFGKMVLMR